MKNAGILFCLIAWCLFFTACKKENKVSDPDILLGVWISASDPNDTMKFVDRTNFYRGSTHFDYQIVFDSIQVKYSGILFINVAPTMHKYVRNGDHLRIDFTNGCYGFESTIMNFMKK